MPSLSAHRKASVSSATSRSVYGLERCRCILVEWAHTVGGGKTTDTLGAEAALDFMFWPWGKSRFGWYLEPSYGYSFASGHEQSLSVSAGLLIKIP